jgi:hypothetical protein
MKRVRLESGRPRLKSLSLPRKNKIIQLAPFSPPLPEKKLGEI